MKLKPIIVLAFAISATSCATLEDASNSSVQKQIAICAGTALLGALVGAATGHDADERKDRALAGAGAGAVICAAWMVLNNDKDRSRIEAAERQAVASGRPLQLSYSGDDGKQRDISVATEDAGQLPVRTINATTSSATVETRTCRYAQTTAVVDSQSAGAAPIALYCRTPQGDWEPHVQAG